MSILYLMIPMGILIVVGALWAFFWAVDSGQFDDLESPSWRILLDDDTQPPAPPGQPADAETPEERQP
ncbi:cbb3-type cytochrome oxidase assembly protein CcoS [Wenzhouxiangella sp. XN24]|uniref:cbb3-type cytochrome oxidase assembly protein CcoS n=1 Tax=Wenzhouxiangella sp. XN24 TaxID=2713569 RepID=UPI0013EA42AE|nr:cbb3-type cytochrome oxidase assembly protein CcoS [Wenzhouxiangella sp. XN24]NGX15716.1 cbb3-type cytochrome oxidase assembly protein CcoS [Wenzhouxiangella sp. XN24]